MMYKETYKETYYMLVTFAKAITVSVLSGIIVLYIFQIRSISIRIKWKLSGRRLPPGPNPWPLVGNLPSLMVEPYETLINLARKYGPVMSFQFGARPAVVFSSSTTAREILKTQDKCFGNRPASVANEIWSQKFAADSFFVNGDEWKDIRKLWTVELMTNRRVRQGQAGRAEEVLLALRALVESTEKSRQVGNDISETVSEYFAHIGGNMISRAVFGQRLFSTSYTNFESSDLASAIKEGVSLLTHYDFRDMFPYLKQLDAQGNSKRLRTAKAKLGDILRPQVDARREEIRNGSRSNDEDFLDVLFSNESRGDSSMSDFRKTEMVMALLTAMVGATGVVIDWALSELLRNPVYLKKCREQLDAVVGLDRLVSESDLPDLPFVRGILLETMRVHPLAAFMVPRQAGCDCEVGGYFIPGGTVALLNVRAINLDPATWPDPHKFNPDRHFKSPDGDVDLNLEDFTILTFGVGRRSCPGKRLAWRALQIILATFLHAFDFKLAGGLRPEDLNMSTVLRLDGPRVEPLKLIPTLRIPRSVIFT